MPRTTKPEPAHESRPNLADLRRRYVEERRPLPAAVETSLRTDPRRGAAQILAAVERRRRKNRAEGQRLRRVLRFENALWEAGVERIAGVDEAGMSPLAGPVVAAAVILRPGWRLPEVDDSKKLKAETRERLAVVIKAEALAWAVGRVEPAEIDDINIYRAGLLAMRRAVEGLDPGPEHLLIDARQLKELSLPQRGIIKGDSESLSIAAASIIAKTTRDRIMVRLDADFPGYGFAKHKGYPVRQHYKALASLGACPEHRRSFAPVREVLSPDPQTELFP